MHMVHGDGMMDFGHLILGALMMFTALKMLGWHSRQDDDWLYHELEEAERKEDE